MTSAVELRGVRFAYDGGRPMLAVEEMRVEAGRRVFLHGPSGSGKTTLLSLIAGVLVAQAGSVRVLGEEMGGMSAGARDRLRGERMGYIFQGFNLIPYLTVEENIALPCRLHAARRRRVAGPVDAEVRRLAERLDIAGMLGSRVTRLSTGQQQRVAIARAVIGRPALVIADEPTSALDTDRRDAFLDLLTELTGGETTLLFVSHDRGLAGHFDEVVELGAL